MANYTEMGIFGPPNTGNLAPTGSTSLVLHPERSEGALPARTFHRR